jgi:hypothetical protein
MNGWAAAKRLARQIVRLVVRKALAVPPACTRDLRAAKTRAAADTRNTAIHEAGRAGRLLTFKSDPTLNGMAGDAAFGAFLRRLNLPR